MGNPTRRVRQPGRTAQGHNKPDCGVCNNGAPGPLGLVVNGLNTGGSCCIEPFDNGGTAMALTADSSNCSRSNSSIGPYYCLYTYDMSFITTPFRWSVTIECVSDGAGGYYVHVGVSLDEILSGGSQHNIAYGDWYSASFASCGDFDCTFPGGAPSGTLTVTDVGGGWCAPGNCGSPTWSLNTGNVDPCPQPAAKNCCCGGTPPPPCYHICVIDNGCNVQVDVRVCQVSANHYSGSQTDPISGVSVSATMDYDPLTGCTIAYTCPGGGHSATFPPDSTGWTRPGGQIHFSASGSGWSISAGRAAQCLPKLCNDCCTASGVSWNYDVDLGPGGWVHASDGGIAPYCENVKGIYTVDWTGGAFAGDCSTWAYGECLGCDHQVCGGAFCKLVIVLSLKSSPCRWAAVVHWDCSPGGTFHDTTAYYESDSFDPTADCSGTFTLTKVSDTAPTDSCLADGVCNGSLPDTIQIWGL